MGHAVRIVAWDRLGLYPPQVDREGTQIHYLQRGWGLSNNRLLLGIPLWMLRVMGYLLRLHLDNKRPDALIVSDFESAFPAALVSMMTNTPFVYAVRDNFRMRWRLRFLVRCAVLFESLVLKSSAAVIVPDENRIGNPEKIVLEKTWVIYNCPPDVPVPSMEGLGTESSGNRQFTIYVSGLLKFDRGIALLLEAVRTMSDIRVMVAGTIADSGMEELLLSSPQVDFRGRVSLEESLRICQRSDVIFAFYEPSTELSRNAASNKWYDAMMAGKPVLTNREINNSSRVEQEGFGYLCSYGDVEELRGTIEYIRSHPEDAKQRGARGRYLFETKYNWSLMERRLAEVLSYVQMRRDRKHKAS